MRGPFKSLTADMTSSEREAWFREQGKSGRQAGVLDGTDAAMEAAYVNSRFRCSHYAEHPKRYRTAGHEPEVREWYCQGTAPGNAWRL